MRKRFYNKYKSYKKIGNSIIKNNKQKKQKILNQKFTYVSRDGHIISMKSSWEVKTAYYFDSLNIKFKYEEMGFKTGVGVYWPDFFLPETQEIIEVKGRLFPKAKIKMEQFQLLFPNIKFTILFKKDLERMGIL